MMTTKIINTLDQDRSFFGHPKGLGFIIFTEAWERFSFYGMQSLLILYMSGYLFEPNNIEKVIGFDGFKMAIEWVFGGLSIQALSAQIFGLYVGLVYFLPVLGGLIGDRYTGRTFAVVFGAILMAIGHFLMAFESMFLFALLFLILGSGFLKGNLASQVGELYTKDDPRRDVAFSFYTVAINLGAFVAPLVCGTLGELMGWHYGFSAAGIGMLIGMLIYCSGLGSLPNNKKAKDTTKPASLQKGDGKTIFGLLFIVATTALFWTAQTQVWNTYPIWVKERISRNIFGWDIPVTWFQSLDMLAVLLFAPVVMWIWRRQSSTNVVSRDLFKIAFGCAVFGVACTVLSFAEWSNSAEEISLFWPVLFHFVAAIGFLYTSPITLSLVSKRAPESINAMMVGCYYLAIFIGGMASGWMGRFYESISHAEFWLLHGAIAASGTVLILIFRRPLINLLSVTHTPVAAK